MEENARALASAAAPKPNASSGGSSLFARVLQRVPLGAIVLLPRAVLAVRAHLPPLLLLPTLPLLPPLPLLLPPGRHQLKLSCDGTSCAGRDAMDM
mmetsp:Transcript_51248/g.141857  ORF Transcript_51248/g.141857 Transcript_51248/m.141857 type:complete len:96 (+) Transcript_51248:224-511(+)